MRSGPTASTDWNHEDDDIRMTGVMIGILNAISIQRCRAADTVDLQVQYTDTGHRVNLRRTRSPKEKSKKRSAGIDHEVFNNKEPESA